MRFWRGSIVPARYWKGRKCICEIRKMTSLELVYCKKFCKEKFSFKTKLYQNSWICEIYKRSYIIFWSIFLNKDVEKPATMMNLISIMGSEPLSMAYLLHQISIYAFLRDYQDVLLSTFICIHLFCFGFVPGIALCQTTRSILRRNTTRRSTTLKTTRTRLVSGSAACWERRDLGATTLSV